MVDRNKIIIIFIYITLLFISIIVPVFILNVTNKIYSLVISPICWGILGFISIFAYKKKERESTKKNIIKSVIIVTFIYMIIYYSIGLFIGYLKSPYSHSISNIIKNTISILFIIIVQENLRNVFVDNANKNIIKFAFITLLFLIINIEWNNFFNNFKDNESIIKYLSTYIIPKLVESMLCTYLVYKDGALASLSYRLVINIFLIFVPVVPDLNWFLSSMISIIVPYFIFIYINYEGSKEAERISKNIKKRQKPISLIITIIILSIIVSFFSGIFKYKPIAIVSNSMIPVFSRGDSVVIKKVNAQDIKSLEIGDIIQYRSENKYVVHRIVEKIEGKKDNTYITKGDNNKNVDSKAVSSDKIVGIVCFSVPFIGYPAVYLSELLL